jgi:enterochelin esterase-like enzyme
MDQAGTERNTNSGHQVGARAFRLGRRGALRMTVGVGAVALSGGLSTVAGAAAPQGAAAASAASASQLATAAGVVVRPLAAMDSAFGAAARRGLATDALSLFPTLSGLFPGRDVFLLPVAPWYSGSEARQGQRSWSLEVPAGYPLYLLAAASPLGRIDANSVTVTLNGEPATDLGAYVHPQGRAIFNGRSADMSVLDLVVPPPPAGKLRIEVKLAYQTLSATIPGVKSGSAGLGSGAGAGGSAGPASSAGMATSAPVADPMLLLPGPAETVLTYDVTVAAPDALSALVVRDSGRRLWALEGNVRRLVPDERTFRALGLSNGSVVDASDTLFGSLVEGAPLPALRDGLLARSGADQPVFRLDGGRREWLGKAELFSDVMTVDTTVVQTIPPLLRDGMLLKGGGSDVFNVDRQSLRKISDWKWVADHNLDPADTLYVPDRVLQRLPQNSPHWVMPGGTFTDSSFQSAVLDRATPYRVYLPLEYGKPEASGKRYPVIYLLHGKSGRYDEWSGYGVEEVANELWVSGKLGPVIMVAPQGGLGYWMNQEGGVAWSDYVARDLVPHVDATYRTVAKREGRAIGGLSMGAHGAIQIAMNFPELFGTVGVHSPSIHGQESAPAYFGKGASFAGHDPISLVKESRVQAPPSIWIDAGMMDVWKAGAEQLHQALVAKGWAHEWHLYDGEHDGWYWGDHIWEYLPFYGQAFVKAGVMEPPAPVSLV